MNNGVISCPQDIYKVAVLNKFISKLGLIFSRNSFFFTERFRPLQGMPLEIVSRNFFAIVWQNKLLKWKTAQQYI